MTVLLGMEFSWDPDRCSHWRYNTKAIPRYWELSRRDGLRVWEGGRRRGRRGKERKEGRSAVK